MSVQISSKKSYNGLSQRIEPEGGRSGNSWPTIHQLDSHGQHLTNAQYGGVLILGLRSAVTHESGVDGQDRTHTLLPHSLPPPRRLHPVLPIPDPTTVIQEFLAPVPLFSFACCGLKQGERVCVWRNRKEIQICHRLRFDSFWCSELFPQEWILRQHSAQNTRAIMEIALLKLAVHPYT